MTEPLSCKLPAFEGPLDLLLYLLQKNKLNIYDIPIAEVLEQYLHAIHLLEEMDMEVATDFLDMAARLVHLKSSMLLPKHEEAEELKRELTGQLIEYQLCKEAAQRLATHHIGADLFTRAPEELEWDLTYQRVHPTQEILQAYLAAAGRGRRRLPPPAQAFSGIVSRTVVSVSSKIIFVLRKLYHKTAVPYDTLFQSAGNKSELVATFLALLELVKGKRIRVDGEGANQSVKMLRREKQESVESSGN